MDNVSPCRLPSLHWTHPLARALAHCIGRFLSIGMFAVGLLASPPSNATTLVGTATISATQDNNSDGMAEAFRATAGADGTATQMSAYLDAASTARTVVLGVFTDSSGHPGSLLTQGVISAPVAGAWNTVTVPPVTLVSGQAYWLAILGAAGGGTVWFRDVAGGGRSETSSASTLSTLPGAWSSGTSYPDGALSMVVSSADSNGSGPLLVTSPSTLSFSAVAGGSNPAAATLNVTNGGVGTLSFTSAAGASWLAVSPSSGTAPATVKVSPSVGGLAAGTYTSQVTIAAGAMTSTIPVTLTLGAPAAALLVSPATLSFSATAGSTYSSSRGRLAISSANGAAQAFTLTSNQPWLTVSSSSGTTPASERVRVSAAGLPAGTYIGQLMITPSGAGASAAVSVPVTYTVASSTPSGHTISGTLSPASLGAGALVTLSGAAALTTTADGSGNYAFSAVADGSYSVSPSNAGIAFSPSAQGVVVNGADVGGVNFTAASNATTLFFDDFAGTSLGSAWTVVQRRGPAVQGENECNTAGAVGVTGGILSITTSATPATCGDAVTAASVQPYTSGDIQWTSLNFTYGSVEVRAKFPPQNTGTWPAIWLLGSNCQAANLINGSEAAAYDGCPAQGDSSYREIDAVECDGRSWCHIVVAQGSAGWSTLCAFPVDANWHVFKLSWTTAAVSMAVDGTPTGCSFANTGLNGPMFLIMQTQTTGAGGVAGLPNNANLPTTFQIDYVKVTQP